MLDVELRELTRGGESVAVEPQVFDLLVHLIENRDHVVTKDDLIETVWDGRIVSESTLTSRINAARRAVGDSGKDQAVIRTIARKGFRFVGDVNASAIGRKASHGELLQLETAPSLAALFGEPAFARPAIAVLPFVDMSPDRDQDYFCEGMAEEIMNALVRIDGIRVASRTATRIDSIADSEARVRVVYAMIAK